VYLTVTVHGYGEACFFSEVFSRSGHGQPKLWTTVWSCWKEGRCMRVFTT
jgi:hypothetical protein